MYFNAKRISLAKNKIKHYFVSPFHLLKNIFNIKNLLNAQRQLMESEMRYRELIDNAKNAFAVYKAVNNGQDFEIINFNKAAEKIEAVDRNYVIGKKVTAVFPGAIEFGILDVFRRVYKTGRPEIHPVSIYKDNRIQGWRDNYIFKLYTGEIVAAYTDETERMQDKENLENTIKKLTLSEQRFKELTELLPVTVFEADAQGNLLYSNKTGLEMFKMAEEQIKDKINIFNLIIPDDSGKGLENIRKVMETEIPSFNYYTARRRDGTTFPAIVRSTPIMDVQGRAVGIRGVVIDYTQHKAYEDKIKKSLEEKEVLLKEIHHRVKNNMQIVNSLLSLQSRNIEDKKTLTMLNDIQNRVMTMALLHESLYKTEDYSIINLSLYIKHVIDHLLFSYAVSKDKVNVLVEINEAIEIDISKVIPCGLIVNELITNVLKYAFPPDCGGELRIKLTAEDNMVEIIVEDNGVGFNSSEALNNAKSLGLKLVQTLVMQLAGELNINSSDNKTIIQIKFQLD